MDYAAYKQFRNELLRERQLLRLDCMNPAQALAPWSNAIPKQTVKAGGMQAIAAWSKASGVALDSQRSVMGRGVRDLLAAVFSCALKGGEELWLPEDVYPVYWELARHAALSPQPFATLPQPNWEFLSQTGECSAALLPVPLSPLGRLLTDAETDAETDALVRWLRGSRHRLLILDAVYTYDFSASRSFTDLFLGEYGDQCIVLWSCTKSWLSPGSLGLAAVPHDLAPALQNHIVPPSEDDFGRIVATLEAHPDLPRMQQAAFDREWQRLAPHIRKAVPDWQPPATGYFSVVPIPFAKLLDEHGALSVPASVFGARHDDVSIVTCLHDLIVHENEARA